MRKSFHAGKKTLKYCLTGEWVGGILIKLRFGLLGGLSMLSFY
jgi:hypothetical protein